MVGSLGFPGSIGGVFGGTLSALGGAPGNPFSAGSLLSIASNLIEGSGGKLFRTIPLSNQNQALYQLRLIDPSGNPIIVYTFPLTPSSIAKRFVSLSSIYDVGGPSGLMGVQRILDNYGNSLPIFSIEGTTGWQFHSTDGYAFTGMDSIRAMIDCINQYAFLNTQQLQSNNPNLYTMEFDDHFYGEIWQVVPFGPQTISQDRQRPLIFNYSIQFAALKDASQGVIDPTTDVVKTILGLSSSAAGGTLGSNLGTMLTGMAAQTAGGLSSVITTGSKSLVGSLFG